MGAALNFKLARPQVTVAGFAADADPRVTPPAANLTFSPQDRVSDQSANHDTKGLAVFVQFVDANGAIVVGPTASFVVWLYDEGSKSWVQGPDVELSVPCNTLKTMALIGRCFIQLTALGSVGAATKVNVYATEIAFTPLGGALV